jgi:hypothetical protein
MTFSAASSMALNTGKTILAHVHSPLLDEVGIAVAVMLTLVGLGLHLYRQRHQISVEERVKDAKMTEDQARRQMRFFSFCAPAATSLGMALLALAIIDLVG